MRSRARPAWSNRLARRYQAQARNLAVYGNAAARDDPRLPASARTRLRSSDAGDNNIEVTRDLPVPADHRRRSCRYSAAIDPVDPSRCTSPSRCGRSPEGAMEARSDSKVTTVEFAIVGVILFMIAVRDHRVRPRRVHAGRAAGGGAARGPGGRRVRGRRPGGREGGALRDPCQRTVDRRNVDVEYLDAGRRHRPATFTAIRYVRVTHRGLSDCRSRSRSSNATFAAPAFSSTLPRESLGVPRCGGPPAC